MAKEQLKKIGITATLVSLSLAVLGLAWTGGSRMTSVEKDIEKHSENAQEDRATVQKLASIVDSLSIEVNSNYKELKQDANDSMLRDERQTTQYAQILSHMTQQTESTKRTDHAISVIQVDVGKMQTKLETLIKDE